VIGYFSPTPKKFASVQYPISDSTEKRYCFINALLLGRTIWEELRLQQYTIGPQGEQTAFL
jgi:hypothetical protein